MATFVSDSFTGANGTLLDSHTGETGATWAMNPASADRHRIQNNRAHAVTAACRMYASGSPATAEYDVQADLFVVTNAGNNGVLGRSTTTDDTSYFARFSNGGGWQLFKLVAGAATSLGSDTTDGTTLTVGTTWTLKLEVRNATKKVFINGTQRISSTNNDITAAGKAGVGGGSSSSTTGYHLDNFAATDAAGAAGQPFALRSCGQQRQGFYRVGRGF